MAQQRTYDEADRQYFRNYIEDRARLRPEECSGGSDCWVEFGPPAMTSNPGRCKGCDGAPTVRPENRYLVRGRYAK
jgi:hypothetical protein